MHPNSPLTELKIYEIKLNQRHPPVSIDDLAAMLEIDSILGRKDDLRRRLQRALDNAFLQGMKGEPRNHKLRASEP